MTYKHSLFVLTLSMLSMINTIHSRLSLKPISSFFGGKPYEAIIEKDYTLVADGRISIRNIHGSIIVKTGLDKKSVAIRGTKRAAVQEHLDHMHIIEEEVKPNRLSLRTAYDYAKVKGTIDYVITIPDSANIHISSDIGDITINQVHGSIKTTTGHGDITIEKPTRGAHATITQQGNITIIQPKGPVQAQSNKGIVNIHDSMNNVQAKVKQGKVEVRCKTLPNKKQIRCSTQQGPIIFHVPEGLQCSLTADTPEGAITSNQPITIKTMITTLNNSYWNKVKKQVRGFIGGEVASVKLYAKKGNIKICAIK